MATFNKKRWVLYLRIGAAYLLFLLFIDLVRHPETVLKKMVNNAWMVIYLVVMNYILFEYTIPFIRLRWTRMLATPFLLFGHLILASFGFYAWRHIGVASGICFSLKTHPSLEKAVEYSVPYSFFSMLFFGVIRYTYDLRKLKQTAQRLRIEKQEAELNFLKSQTNPHFLFNTLNNIYSLTRDKSDLAPESILRLSKILRYMLYEAGGEYIAIEQELKIISDYIALEQLRYDESLLVNFNYYIGDMKQSLPPLLLIPLVENAFKHGVSETRNRPFVDIHCSVNNQQLQFIVKNSTETLPADGSLKENIGLANLRRQLELLYKEFNLTVQQGESVFTASLQINLKSHV
ncbi:sensor histidine kinase [Niastella populi]|uniref:Histidine kinase n=1 Tax=Niastella populi TaxID=550983 RepID=A0A1V9FDL3_9BACT|nr:sensor histidine kinase [Niastella populi]OQP56468.1 histidine kinase [Niastella populi]